MKKQEGTSIWMHYHTGGSSYPGPSIYTLSFPSTVELADMVDQIFTTNDIDKHINSKISEWLRKNKALTLSDLSWINIPVSLKKEPYVDIGFLKFSVFI